MARRKTHKHVEFMVERVGSTKRSGYLKTFDEAAGLAVAIAASEGVEVHIDTIVWSRAGARWLMGDEGAEQYDEDPEASVFDRIVVSAEAEGRIA